MSEGGVATMNNKRTVLESSWSGKSAQIRPGLRIRRILAPTDLTCDDRKAIDYAVAFASRFRAELVLLHVYEAEGGVDYSVNLVDDTIVDENRERAEDALRELCADLSKSYPHCDMCFRSGKPSEQIADAARNLDVDLIVVSTHSRHWHPQLLFGKSVAENLLRHAPCPVLVVRNNK